MNKSELVNAVAEQTMLSKREAEAAINALTGTITEQLQKGESVVLVGFGSFQAKDREARTGRNPKTGESMLIPGKRVPSFKAGATLKASVN